MKARKYHTSVITGFYCAEINDGMWRSPVARTAGGREVAGSNPVIPTMNIIMRQKVSIRGIIKKEGKTLLARRATGRTSILGKYELPGGSLDYNEQPQDSLKRYIKKYLNGRIETLQLFDTVSFVDPDDSETQYIFIVYMVSLSDGNLSAVNRYDKYIWEDKQYIQQEIVTASTVTLLGLDENNNTNTLINEKKENIVVENISDKITIYSDGGSRGNPGPSASAYVIVNSKEEVIESGGVYLGITTNNQAEYQAVSQALKKAKELGIKKIDFRLDSNLVVNQLNGLYKIKNRDLWPIYQDIKDMLSYFEKISFTHIPRELNHQADGLVNKILDEQQSTTR